VPSKIYLSVFFVCWLTLRAVAQNPAPGPPAYQPPVIQKDAGASPGEAEEMRARLEHDAAKKAAKERVAALKNDTDKLLKLSVELKTYVDKSDENVLSLNVIKKAEEIEKLAKSVKEKMRGPD
jgi:hypothetical protein